MARILIIDDDEIFRDMLVRMLRELGHTPMAAANGLEGIKLFRAAPTDLILTDIMMPYGGLATIRILRTEFPNLGIIAMSGGAGFRLDYAADLGAYRQLAKPFTQQQLMNAIMEVLAARPGKPPRSNAS